MKYDPKEFRALPNVINKEQMRIACHISKRTALYLLQSGLIPNETTGKKTRCYSVKKKDVIVYLKDREANPNKYQPPENWYADFGGQVYKPHVIRCLPSSKASKQQMEAYYKDRLSEYSDVMDIDAICKFTGYNRRTVGAWCRAGKLRYIMATPKYMIPKCFLTEWLASERYNITIRKTQKHLNAIWEIHEHPHIGASIREPIECNKKGT